MCGELFAQADSTKAQVEKQLEEAFEELDTETSELSGEQLTQFLEDLAANPVNINTAGIDDLLQIPGLNLKLARALIDYRKQKPFEKKEELLKVSGIGKATYSRIQPYITVAGGTSRFRTFYSRPQYWLAGNKIEFLSRFQQNIEDQEGYNRPDTSGGYLGSPVKYYQRFKLQSNHLSVNFTQEKDAGEELNGVTGFDYTSWHIALTNNGKLNSLVIGDYSLSFGQGLVLWTGGAFGKGREVTGTVSKNERGLRPYSSAQETDFFRGVAASYGNKLQVTAFYSDRPRTASVIFEDTTHFPSSSGFHRTQSEYDRRNNIDQAVYGGRLKWDTQFGIFGATGYVNEFSTYIQKSTSVSDRYDFEGQKNSVIGADYRALIGNALVFGEAARSKNGGMGAIAGMETPIGYRTDFAALYRNYQKDFQSFMGYGFGESSGHPANETGLYLGLRHQFERNIAVSGYFDQYSFKAPRFGTTRPTSGYDVLGLIEGEIVSDLSAYLLIRNEIKDDEYIVEDDQGVEEKILGKEKRVSFRLQTEYQAGKNVRLRSRGEYVRYQKAGTDWENGFLLYEDLRINITRKLQIDTRLTFFDTDNYDTRVYQYESDLLYVMSNTALYDEGQRAYVVVKYEPTNFLQLWIKYAITKYEDTQIISSGLNEIKGDTKSFVGIQARFLFR